jgi:hypothetical protein
MYLLNLTKKYFHFWKCMNAQQKQVEQRKDDSVSPEESRALKFVQAIAVNKFLTKRRYPFFRTL